MPCLTGKLESVETQHAAIAVSKRVDPVQLVDVMAKSVEKILGAETPKLVMGGKILEGGRQAVRDIGRVNKQAPALLNIHRAILPRPFVEVLEQMLVNGAIAFGIERKGHARGLPSTPDKFPAPKRCASKRKASAHHSKPKQQNLTNFSYRNGVFSIRFRLC